MPKKNKTYVNVDFFLNIAKELDVPVQEQAAFYKLSGADGRYIYVAKTKEVGRIDIAGFEMTGPGVIDLGGASKGAVHQQLNFTLSQEQILACFKGVLEHMKTLDPAEKKKRGSSYPGGVVKAVEAKKPEADDDAAKAEKARHLAAIQKYAEEHGTTVSEKTLKELS